ncbi:MAG: hypothetical protein ACLTYN_10325 [Dysosmobacter welbionis]
MKGSLLDCFTAPCRGCPSRDIPEYIELYRKGAYASALRLITEKTPAFHHGTICAHNCMTKVCGIVRRAREHPGPKLVAAERAMTPTCQDHASRAGDGGRWPSSAAAPPACPRRGVGRAGIP